jgi:hypothetical protein
VVEKDTEEAVSSDGRDQLTRLHELTVLHLNHQKKDEFKNHCQNRTAFFTDSTMMKKKSNFPPI